MPGTNGTNRGLELSAAAPADFARLVAAASPDQLREVMGDNAVRVRILQEIFTRMRRRYRGGSFVNGVVHWRILDKPGGGHDFYEIILNADNCTVNQHRTTEPRVTISLSGPEFLKLASGNSSATMMFFSGKLKVTGDIGFAAGLATMFDLPKA